MKEIKAIAANLGKTTSVTNKLGIDQLNYIQQIDFDRWDSTQYYFDKPKSKYHK